MYLLSKFSLTKLYSDIMCYVLPALDNSFTLGGHEACAVSIVEKVPSFTASHFHTRPYFFGQLHLQTFL